LLFLGIESFNCTEIQKISKTLAEHSGFLI